ncbi:MAG: hypothetical protein NTX49_03050 [Chlamydiae bacterium]|nr:hypothetical protein [Chlamydiota bacterium]
MKNTIIVFTAASLFLTGCASYNALPLNSMSSQVVNVSEPAKHSNLVVAAKKLSRAECLKYFDRDVIKEGYQPIQLYIQNDTNDAYIFSLNRISLATARPEEVAEKVHTSTVARATLYGAGALILWPLAIPAVIDGVKSAQANEALDADFDSKVAKDQVITKHSHINKILFVPRNEVDGSFTITLLDAETHAPKTIEVLVTAS